MDSSSQASVNDSQVQRSRSSTIKPDGRDKSKRKMRAETDNASTLRKLVDYSRRLTEALEESLEHGKKLNEVFEAGKKNARDPLKRKLAKEEELLKTLKWEEEIMSTDTSNMTPQGKKWYRITKCQILRDLEDRQSKTSRSLNFADDD